MSVIEELIRVEENGKLSFGNYEMDEKRKVLDFDVNGDLYKVKTFKEITKLEKNGKLLLESVPGSTIHNFEMDDKIVAFEVEGNGDVQITLELESDKTYRLFLDNNVVGDIKSNLSGKISLNVESSENGHTIRLEK